MYSFFYGTCVRASTNYLDTARRTVHFMQAGEALTNAADSSIAYTHTHCRREGNKLLMRRREREREARQNELKKEARLKVRKF